MQRVRVMVQVVSRDAHQSERGGQEGDGCRIGLGYRVYEGGRGRPSGLDRRALPISRCSIIKIRRNSPLESHPAQRYGRLLRCGASSA